MVAAAPGGSNRSPDVALAKMAGWLVPCARTETIADGLQGEAAVGGGEKKPGRLVGA